MLKLICVHTKHRHMPQEREPSSALCEDFLMKAGYDRFPITAFASQRPDWFPERDTFGLTRGSASPTQAKERSWKRLEVESVE
jgi:hypothetical protein